MTGDLASAFVVSRVAEPRGTAYVVRSAGVDYYTHHAGYPGADPATTGDPAGDVR